MTLHTGIATPDSATDVLQLHELLGAVDLALAPEEIAALDRASAEPG